MSTIPNSPPPPATLTTGAYADGLTHGQASQGQGQVNLSMEEQRVIRSCQSESFWYRSLPLGALFASASHFGVMRGYLKPHPNWGARPKVILGSIVGYFVGKFSYVDVCADKFLAEAPDSNIAESIRARRGLPLRRQPDDQSQHVQEAPAMFPPVQQQSPIYQNQASPTYGQQGQYQEQASVGVGSYEELRKRNREAAQNPVGAPSGGAGVPYNPLAPPPPPVPDYPASKLRVTQPQTTNKYGDEGFE